MKTKNLFIATVVSAGLTFGVTAQAKEEKHEEQTINSSDVPAAVQQAAQAEAKGGADRRRNGCERQSAKQTQRSQRAQRKRREILIEGGSRCLQRDLNRASTRL